jgi:CCR4-NOT transcription complex subunit 1
LGILTVAINRPIYAKELDLKQMLVEGFTSEKLKLTVFFVCRILKECQKSTVFKHQNPWVKAILEILREIYDYS